MDGQAPSSRRSQRGDFHVREMLIPLYRDFRHPWLHFRHAGEFQAMKRYDQCHCQGLSTLGPASISGAGQTYEA